MTREHLFGQWVSKIGLDLSPAQHFAGPLNALPRDMGTRPPYRQTVKDICAGCNNGWMSQLEEVAQRVLSPMILGKAGQIAFEDQAAIVMWAQKTALISLLLSSEAERDEGYGVPEAEYRALAKNRDELRPLISRFWVGRYASTTDFPAIRVTPIAIHLHGRQEPNVPDGYIITIVLGELIIHGVRFTVPGRFDLTLSNGMPQLWPYQALALWPQGEACTAESFLSFADGGMLQSEFEDLELRPWTPASELPPSDIVDGKVALPALCRRHTLYYPMKLVREAFQSRFYAFTAECECSTTYLIQTADTGARCKGEGTAEQMAERLKYLPGTDAIIPDHGTGFACKRLLA